MFRIEEKMKLKTNTIFIVILVGTIMHFIITSIVGHYIATQVGALAGNVIAEGLLETTEKPYLQGDDANKIYQSMKTKINEEYSRWEIPSFLISLPIIPVLKPLKKVVEETWVVEPVRVHQISLDEVKRRGSIIDNVANGLNSISFGILIYLAYSLIMKVRSRQPG
jgi:hypothetical protein